MHKSVFSRPIYSQFTRFYNNKNKFKLHRLTHMFTSIKTGNQFKLQPRNFFKHIFHTALHLLYGSLFKQIFRVPQTHSWCLFNSTEKVGKNNLQNAPAFTDYNLNRVKTWHALYQRAKVNRMRFPLARTDRNPSLKENNNKKSLFKVIAFLWL